MCPRAQQLIVANHDDCCLAGGSPWEVPFGELVGEASYAALDRFYAGYGDMRAFGGQAPAQGQIYRRGAAYLDEEFPLLDFMTSCEVEGKT
mgnify:CR=1 FL=1